MSEAISCPKCSVKLSGKTELEKHDEGSSQDDLLDPTLEVSSTNWEKEILQSNKLVVVEFWHESCPSCKEFAPTYIKVAKEYDDKLKFAKLNVLKNKENRDIAVKHGLTSTPTLIFFCNGKPIATKVGRDGFETEQQFKQLIKDMINKCPKNTKTPPVKG